ncbi:nitrous oxide-stimulated promoter family protein [Desulforhopalus vacuolatus]|uniref:nitrous oxide-stimulated promoter family protein n=1 Tax=Desulforhopalus vacuolatus TaxID=40414 RepID=UPI0019668447|nr:nitrous oxide-stimulated promoter family protein [Desulforhopalus vacuolatus]MBM9520988.1 nitrous oxide-stimulated promoter family protein [Desulforhopalus vacuolatus]
MPFTDDSKRFQRELKTMRAIISLYCCREHGGRGICPHCQELLNYAENRLKNCVHGEASKPACQNCQVHCYSRGRREEMRKIMSRTGMRMALHHPGLTLQHFFDCIGKTGKKKTSAP